MKKCIVRDDQVYTMVLLETLEVDIMSTRYKADCEFDAWLRRTDKGKWCNSKCIEIDLETSDDFLTATTRVYVIGYMTDKNSTAFYLKWRSK